MNDIELLERIALNECRDNFWAFRQYINSDAKRPMKKGWFQKRVAYELQQWWEDKLKGLRPKTVIQAPPQHGKSYQLIDFIAWMAGKDPELRTIYTSFSERLGVRANMRLQRIFESEKYKKVFPNTRIGRETTAKSIRRAIRTTDLLEYTGHEGYFRNTTVGGAITGEGLDIGVIDDPLKGREAAGSLKIRDKVWDWFTDDFFSRFADDAGFIVILTRWHIDDPVGRMKEKFPDLKILTFPALAEPGAKLMPDDPRTPGSNEPLFPELKSKEFLLERKSLMSSFNWSALYQQEPQIQGGEIIKGKNFTRYRVAPKIIYRKIFADTAQKTKERNDYSVFECWGKGEDGKIYLLDLIRGKWESHELKKRAKDFWSKHKAQPSNFGNLRKMAVEDKASGTGLIQDIRHEAQIPIEAIQRHIDKLTRVLDVVDYIDSGYVCIPEDAPWITDFISECEAFTSDDSHAFDDQIDPMCDAISDMLASRAKGFYSDLEIKLKG